MKFANSAACLLALAIASPFLLHEAEASEVVFASELPKRRALAKRRPRGTTPLEKKKVTRDAESSGTETRYKRRRLGGKGGGSSSGITGSSRHPPKFPDSEDFYRYSCEFCGEGNDSALGLSPFDISTGGACFSEDMTAEVLGRGPVSMKDLRVGDKVLTQNGLYEPVYAFAHRDSDRKATFLQIHGEKGDPPLEMTSGHLVFLANKKNPVLAKSIKVGDQLQSSNSDVAVAINKIEKVEKAGIYAPLTLGGSIVVNKALASSYISLQDMTSIDSISQTQLSREYMVIQGSELQIPIMSHHQYVDMAIAPYRMACRVMGSALCDTTKSNVEGMPLYVRLGMIFNKMSAPHWQAHPLTIFTTIVATGPFWLFERALCSNNGSTSWAAMAVLFLAVAGWMRKKRVTVATHEVTKSPQRISDDEEVALHASA